LRKLLDEGETVVPAELLYELHRFTVFSVAHTETERGLPVGFTALGAWI